MSKKINSPENEINHLYNNSSIQSPSGFPEGYLPMIDEPIDLGSFQSIDDKEFQAKINNENLPPLVNCSKEYSLKQSEIKITENLNSKYMMSQEKSIYKCDGKANKNQDLLFEISPSKIGESNGKLTDQILNMILESEQIHSFSQVKDKLRKAAAAENMLKMLNKDIESEHDYINLEEARDIFEGLENFKETEKPSSGCLPFNLAENKGQDKHNILSNYTNNPLKEEKMKQNCTKSGDKNNISKDCSEKPKCTKVFARRKLVKERSNKSKTSRNLNKDIKHIESYNTETQGSYSRRLSIVNYQEDKYKRSESRTEHLNDFFKTEKSHCHKGYNSMTTHGNNHKNSRNLNKLPKCKIYEKEEHNQTASSNLISKVSFKDERQQSLRKEFEHRHNVLKEILKRKGSQSVRSLNRSNCTASTLNKKHLTRASSKNEHKKLTNILSISNLEKQRKDRKSKKCQQDSSENSEIYYI